MNFISIILIAVIYLMKIFIKNYKSLILQQRYHCITTEIVAFKINIKNPEYPRFSHNNNFNPLKPKNQFISTSL